MKLAIGMITAPRTSPTVTDSITSVRNAFITPMRPVLFAEPGTFSSGSEIPAECLAWNRVVVGLSETEKQMPTSPTGKLGNFGNWIQSARDLLWLQPDADTILMCEDDIELHPNLTYFIADRLWPSSHCGCISLYCAPVSHYRHSGGLIRTGLQYTEIMSTHHNLLGALCLLFPRRALQDIVDNQSSIDEWRGSHAQRRAADLPLWERKAVDTWIGRTLIQMGYEIWNFNPGLVRHTGVTSSLGNSTNRSRTNAPFTGMKTDLAAWKKPKERHVDVCPNSK